MYPFNALPSAAALALDPVKDSRLREAGLDPRPPSTDPYGEDEEGDGFGAQYRGVALDRFSLTWHAEGGCMDSFFAEGKSVSRFCSHLVTLVVDDHACLLSPRPGGGMPMGSVSSATKWRADALRQLQVRVSLLSALRTAPLPPLAWGTVSRVVVCCVLPSPSPRVLCPSVHCTCHPR